jgi:hypothetical protein
VLPVAARRWVLTDNKYPFSKSQDKSVQGRHTAYELMEILDHPWSPHVYNGGDLLRVCFNSSVTDDEIE